MSENLYPAYEPDYAVPPGETLREYMEEAEVDEAYVAAESGLTVDQVTAILCGEMVIDTESAERLEKVSGIPAGMWLRLEANYRAALVRRSK